MKKLIKIGSVLLMLVMLSSLAAAVQKPAVQLAGSSPQAVDIGQDVITASDAGGGRLNQRDILIVIVVVLAVIGFAVVF